jgi:hypothetical protein
MVACASEMGVILEEVEGAWQLQEPYTVALNLVAVGAVEIS